MSGAPTPEPRSRRERAIPAVIGLLCFAVALAQRPGETSADTKIDLHVDPVGFLSDAAAVWTNSGALGEVQGGQYAGYLFPMGPFFALGNLLGLGDWVVNRLWVGALLALAAWGTVRLMDALRPGPRGPAHVIAALLMAFNPYNVVYIDRTSVTLLGVAALPWLMLAVHRGLREPRRWWWPAAIALIVTAAGAGVNAAVTAWVLAGPLALALYEWGRGAVDGRSLVAFGLRVAALGIPASAWWAGPVLVQTLYGIDFLQFTEQPGAIWASTSLSESFRLMGYWPSYLGVGYGSLLPFYETSPDLLFSAPVVVATLLVPALAVAGFAAARRWAYGPFFLGLLLLGLLVMTVGFPEGTPMRKGVTFVYNTFSPVQFLRTTHKAGPLVMLSLACLAGAGGAWLLRGRGRGGSGRHGRGRGGPGGRGGVPAHPRQGRRRPADLRPRALGMGEDGGRPGPRAGPELARADPARPAACLLPLGADRGRHPARPDRPARGHPPVRAPGGPALLGAADRRGRAGPAGAPGARPAPATPAAARR